MFDVDRELVSSILWAWSHLMILLMTVILYRLSSRLLTTIREAKSILGATIGIAVRAEEKRDGIKSTCTHSESDGWMTMGDVRQGKGLARRSNRASRCLLLHLPIDSSPRQQDWESHRMSLRRLRGALVLAAAFLSGQCEVVPLRKEAIQNR